jgi:hypothetical protein
MARTGESWVTALRNVRAQVSAEAPPPAASAQPDRLADLLRRLGATNTFPIRVGRGIAVGGSANMAAAEARARERMGGSRWYAASGGVEMNVTQAEYDLLLAGGAAEDTAVQILRSFHAEPNVGFSVQCCKCDRWIWCGHEEREGACACGQRHRVTFDLALVHRASALRNMRCMDCGAEQVEAGGSPWTPSGEWQVRCDECSRNGADPGARRARLIFATARGRQVVELRSANSLGRHPTSSIQLLDKIVAKEHCVIERRAGSFVVRDLGTLNGTYVNGERVRGERTLEHGDELALGATRARYRRHRSDELRPSSHWPRGARAVCTGAARATELGGTLPGRRVAARGAHRPFG